MSATPSTQVSRDFKSSLFPWISTVARLLLAVVWVWAGSAKIVDPAVSAQAVRAFQLLPEGLVKPVGYGLPFLELGLALLLLVGLGTRLVAVLSALLLLVFIGGIASAWVRGLTIDCGCFGGGGQVTADQTKYLQEILRDLGFMLLAGWLILMPTSRFSVERWILGDSVETTQPVPPGRHRA